MKKEMQIVFGAVSDKPSVQLKRQGIVIDNAEGIKFCDIDASQISRLYVRGLLSDSEFNKANKRLFEKIKRLLKR